MRPSEADWADLHSRLTGAVGRVLSVRPDGQQFHVVFRNGLVSRIDATEPLSFELGDIVLVGDERAELAPSELWQDERSVVIIREVYNDRLLIETNGHLRLVSRTGPTTVSSGNTVEFSEVDGVVRVLSNSPIRPRIIDSDDDIPVDRFRHSRAQTGPSFADFGGYSDVVERARELIETQLNKKTLLDRIGARPVKGIMFTGESGTGKTLLAQIIANESDADFFLVSGPAIMSKFVGDSEDLLRKIFSAAEQSDRGIIFFDEIDSLAARRSEESHEMSKRLVAQLLTLMDGFDRTKGNVVVIAATNRIESIDDALMRPGRFDWVIEFGMPSIEDRLSILQVSAAAVRVSGQMPLDEIAASADGWSAAELTSLWTEAAFLAARDSRDAIAEEDLCEAFERAAAGHAAAMSRKAKRAPETVAS